MGIPVNFDLLVENGQQEQRFACFGGGTFTDDAEPSTKGSASAASPVWASRHSARVPRPLVGRRAGCSGGHLNCPSVSVLRGATQYPIHVTYLTEVGLNRASSKLDVNPKSNRQASL